MADFIHVKVSDDIWLSACGKCRRVLSFGPNIESLEAAEMAHECLESANEQVAKPADAA